MVTFGRTSVADKTKTDLHDSAKEMLAKTGW